MMIMWNSKSLMAGAIVGVGLAATAATPAAAQYRGGYTVYGPNPWNQGAWGGPWFSGPAYGAAWPAPWSAANAYSPVKVFGLARPYGYGGY
jgi:hypothetical protein